MLTSQNSEVMDFPEKVAIANRKFYRELGGVHWIIGLPDL